jgi:hypothetical protein
MVLVTLCNPETNDPLLTLARRFLPVVASPESLHVSFHYIEHRRRLLVTLHNLLDFYD